MPYRTDASALGRERARMLAELKDLESRFTDVFWQELAAGLGVSRWSLEDAPRSAELAARDALMRSEAARSTRIEDQVAELGVRIAALERVIARWSSLTRAWRRPASRAPRGDGSRSGGADPTVETVLARERIESMLRELRPRLPVDVRVKPNGALRVHWAIATSAPRGVGAVRLEPERLLDDLRKVAGVLTDIDVGDDRFDGAFLVRGHEPTVRAVLDRETRGRLLRLDARCADLRVDLDAGEAVVRMHSSPTVELLEDALAVLARLRRAPVRALRNDEA
ncbi:hypothetical protein [Sandaracinus amylolyticus]|nr:hypothetical protein [Sandaracinus amylolyticus]